MRQRKTGNVPKLRFPEFRNKPEWKEKILSKVAELVEEKAGASKYTLMSVTSGIGLVSQIEKFGREIAGNQYKNYYVIKKGDFAYNKSATKQYPEGYISMLVDQNEAALPNSIFTCFRIVDKNTCPQFLNHLFHANFHGIWLRKFITVGARAHGSLNVDSDDLFRMPIKLPIFYEQQKIADCLSSLDELIAAHTQKLDSLKAYKKGLTQQLLPAEGETVPKLRFPEFRDAPEWESLSIGKKVYLLSGYPFDGISISENSCGIRLLRGINITDGTIRHNKKIDRYYIGNTDKLEKYSLRSNDLVIGMDGSKVGKNAALITPSDTGALLVQRVARLRSNCVTSIQFISQHINSYKFHAYVDRINTSSGIPHISAKQINEFQISFPCIKEQQKIADCLSAVDELITSQIQKLDAFKTQKRGLMLQLFTSAGEVHG